METTDEMVKDRLPAKSVDVRVSRQLYDVIRSRKLAGESIDDCIRRAFGVPADPVRTLRLEARKKRATEQSERGLRVDRLLRLTSRETLHIRTVSSEDFTLWGKAVDYVWRRYQIRLLWGADGYNIRITRPG